jgi:phosphoglycerate dehydrogenase-like enzyme
MKLKLVVTPPQDDLTRRWAARLQGELPGYLIVAPETDEDARRELADADAAYGWVPPEALPTAAKLRWLQNPFAGPFPNYYYPELIAHPVMVTNPRGIYSDHIAHHVMTFILALARGLPYYMDAQRARRWDKNARKQPYVYLAEATVLIAGVGGIGAEVARLCQAFGMKLLGVDPRPEHAVKDMEIYPVSALERLLPQADFVVATTPHTPQTEGMWNAQRFAQMKRTAHFINIGRGKTTRLDDLADAIEKGVIAGCGLDVYEVEPLPPEHRLWTLPNVLLTPHIAVRDAENVPERRFQILLDNARRFAAGQPLHNLVDKAAWF